MNVKRKIRGRWPLHFGPATFSGTVTLNGDSPSSTTGISSFAAGTYLVAQTLNANPGAVVIPMSINVQHAGTDGDMDDYVGWYNKFEILGVGDADLTAVGDATRLYVGKTGGANNSVVGELYANQPWVKHEGTGTVLAMSALSAKCDVSADNFTATNTVNAGHFHIEGAATVTGQFDGVMIEAYGDVTSLDSMLALLIDGSGVTSAIRLAGTCTNLIAVPAAGTAPVVADTTAMSTLTSEGYFVVSVGGSAKKVYYFA